MDMGNLEDRLTDEDRRFLCDMPSWEEVREIVFSIEPESVAGPDGFGAFFYHTCWDFMSDDVFGAVTEFFWGVALPKTFTATTISLIPKTDFPASWSEYRPISLCNVTNKICTKLMTIRLGRVLPKVLALSQSGFIPGRLLSDNVLLAQELIHSLESRRSDANVIFKLDMAKAYDRPEYGVALRFSTSILVGIGTADQQREELIYCRPTCFDLTDSDGADCNGGWAMTNLSHGGQLALIKSVLQATPLHLLQVISPRKSVLLAIERIFNGFFWGSYNGRKHIHWTSWAKFGTGYVAFEIWRSRFIFWVLGNGEVSFWHDNWFREKILAQLVHRESYTMEPVRYYWHQGEWNVPRIFRTVPTHIAQVICQIPVAADQDDKIVWTRSSDGVFSTRAAWETIRVVSPRR
ncbi:UNVERIFIED_CONTAM: hypothetical protein Slati_3512800 [Sesamum latifolium]|uniref:Reverse transcriptase domain-containing protein n=1 Tax=Sesamum latifolium TaxID=2727402 RepID=A0AAW2UII8_9LAMI